VDTYRARGKVANEYLDIIQALARDNGATVEGAFRTVRDAHANPKADFPNEPPVWIGGNSVAAMRRAARYGRGWIFSGALSPVALREQLGSAEPVTAPFDVVLTATAARQEGQPAAPDGDGHSIHQHASVMSGSAEEVAQQMQDYLAAGVTHFLLTFRSTQLAELKSQMRWFATDVRPRLALAEAQA
jgi:alkanesulfonate monooxygenase SsuD/methylene tetrahydromethanopterin reductase-like flavin-dependent oxidoreductase (luciferase family)